MFVDGERLPASAIGKITMAACAKERNCNNTMQHMKEK
jgi:hypothetical protein